ncbi:MAG: tRNA adenosine deaminase-associated protein [Actinobacteria bacterium]|nr:tRNA adenosine deaminase-associated protein [Actinomycetota bacterium]
MADSSDEEYDLGDRGDDRPGLEDADPDVVDADIDTDDDEDEDEDDVEDALEDDVDFIMALYREDGTPVVTPLDINLANDLDDLIAHLQRLPGDNGASALVSISGEFFAAVRVRGRHVHVVLSDVYAAESWSLARDIVDFLGIDIPEEDDEDGLVGDLDLFADQGLSEMDLEAICADLDEDSDTLALQIADEIHFGPQARTVADSFS